MIKINILRDFLLFLKQKCGAAGGVGWIVGGFGWFAPFKRLGLEEEGEEAGVTVGRKGSRGWITIVGPSESVPSSSSPSDASKWKSTDWLLSAGCWRGWEVDWGPSSTWETDREPWLPPACCRERYDPWEAVASWKLPFYNFKISLNLFYTVWIYSIPNFLSKFQIWSSISAPYGYFPSRRLFNS